MTKDYSNYTLQDLGGYYYDYYKEVHNSRDHFIDYSNRDELLKGLESLDRYMDSMKSDKEGRNQLRNEGWIINEPSAAEDGWVDPYKDMPLDFNLYSMEEVKASTELFDSSNDSTSKL